MYNFWYKQCQYINAMSSNEQFRYDAYTGMVIRIFWQSYVLHKNVLHYEHIVKKEQATMTVYTNYYLAPVQPRHHCCRQQFFPFLAAAVAADSVFCCCHCHQTGVLDYGVTEQLGSFYVPYLPFGKSWFPENIKIIILTSQEGINANVFSYQHVYRISLLNMMYY